MSKKTILVPDSLDLMEHARLGINGICGTCDPGVAYEPYFLTFTTVHPPYFTHNSSMVSGVMPKFLEAMPLLRCMSGEEGYQEDEQGIIRGLMEHYMGEDGLIYDTASPDRPWHTGLSYGLADWVEDYANLAGNGRAICGMYYYYLATGDEKWKEALIKAADRLCDLMVVKDDYAYIPLTGCGNDFSYPRESGWTNTNEPKSSQDGREGAAQFYHTQMARGLTRAYKLTGNKRYMDITKKTLDFIMQPQFWGGVADLDAEYGAYRGHFWGHHHGNLAAARGILEYGLAAEDAKYIQFAKDMYDWSRQNICVELGQNNGIEGCALADMLALAVQLSESGAGDYYDDVEWLMHNAVSQAQVTDREELTHVSEMGPYREKDAPWGPPYDDRLWKNQQKKPMPTIECIDNVIDRSIGTFAWNLEQGRYHSSILMSCCTGNGNQAFYFAWHATLKISGSEASVNMFFNRFAPELDVLSYLPYEGKLVIRNKTCTAVNVRIPSWIKKSSLIITVDGRPVEYTFVGRYARVGSLNGGEEIQLSFPLETVKKDLMIPTFNVRKWKGNPVVTAYFRGPVCIGLDDHGPIVGGDDFTNYRIFRKAAYKLDKAPVKEVPYHVPENTIEWY